MTTVCQADIPVDLECYECGGTLELVPKHGDSTEIYGHDRSIDHLTLVVRPCLTCMHRREREAIAEERAAASEINEWRQKQ